LIKPVLPFLETMATQVCNLSCEGCTNYSDLTYSGYVRWVDMKQQISSWLQIIDIADFGIMGGEPLINPEIYDCVSGVRDLLPSSQIRFTTNGLLLDRHLDILDLIHNIGNIVFKITVHKETPELLECIDYIFKRYAWQPVTEFGINRWKTDRNVRFQINRPERFIKTFRGTYATMKPYKSNVSDSFAMCIQQTCPLLYNGKIYKCSTQGLLKDTLARFNNPNYPLWEPHMVDGISITDSVESIQEFINNFGKPHSICAMCPSVTDVGALIEHHATWKNKKIL